MQTISYSNLRQNLSFIMDSIEDNREAVHITRKGHEPMVMMTQADYNSIQETLYLLSSPKNADRLNQAIADAGEGNFVEVNWDED